MTDIIFDLYGTLINIYTNEKSKSFWKHVAHKFKKYKSYTPTHLKDEYLKLCAIESLKLEEIDLLCVFEKLFDCDSYTAGIIAKDFRRLSIKKIKIYKGAYKLLSKLRDLGYSLYLLSNAQECFTKYELHKFKIDVFFNDIAISSNYGIKKPNKEFFKKLMDKNNIKDAIMIGNDYICDIAPANALGLKTIYIETETSRQTLNVSKIKGFDYKKILDQIQKFSNPSFKF